MSEKQYKLRFKVNQQWTGWQAVQPDTFQVNLDVYDSIEWRDTPQACTVMAPFEVEYVGRPTCESLDAQECINTGTHKYDVETEDYDCYHTTTITWSATGQRFGG